MHLPIDFFYSRADTASVDEVSQTLRGVSVTIHGEVSELILIEFTVVTYNEDILWDIGYSSHML